MWFIKFFLRILLEQFLQNYTQITNVALTVEEMGLFSFM